MPITSPSRGKPFVWATWLTPILASEAQCHYAAWVKSHHRYLKRPEMNGGDLASWNEAHGQLLERRRRELERDGWVLTVEKW